MTRAERTTGAASIDDLTPRRRELLALVAKGLTNDEIARALAISPGTVRSHVATLLELLDVANRTEAAALYVAWEARPTQVAVVLQRPAIAVLPIAAPPGDAHAATVAAGITEDLASLFSRWCWFPVIATASSASARGPGRTSGEIAQSLGARFLVEGSLRGEGERWRLSVHVDDAQSGHRLWGEQDEFASTSLFDLQDALCQRLVAAAYPVLVARAQAARPVEATGTQVAAWELAHEGMILRARRDPDACLAAAARLDEAVARDPGLVLAHYGRGLVACDAVLNQWGNREQAIDQIIASGEHCLALAPHGAEGHYLLGRHRQARGQWVRAIEPLEAAVGRNPSFALAHASLAQSLQVAGRADEGLVRMRHAMRLGPSAFVAGLATLHFMRGEDREALDMAERALVTNPRYAFARALAAAASWWLGDADRTSRHVRGLADSQPPFTASRFAATFGADVPGVDRLTRALSELGL